MSNEGLALRVQAGSVTAMDELTRQNKGMMHNAAYRLYMAQGGPENPYGMELEDAAQIAYMGLYGAAMAYREERGYLLLTYLWRQTLRAFRDMYYTQGKDPLKFACSLDAPLPGEDEDYTLADAQADETALQAFDDRETALYWQQARAVLNAALDTLTAKQGQALRLRYYEGQQLAVIGEQQGRAYQAVHTDIRQALYKLRRCRALREYYSGYITDRAYRATGLTAYRERGGSHMEILVERVDK